MKTGLLFGLVVPTLLLSALAAPARADDKAVCVDASSKGQRFRDAHKLVEAREQLRVCAAARCPTVIQSDCAAWLADVEKALPSIVLAAKSRAGVDLAEVVVSVDGQPLVSRLDGQAMAMNAGAHTFHFEATDGTRADRQVLVKEGEKNLAVAVVLGAEPPPQSPPVRVESTQDARKASTPWRTVGWVLGGAGVVGLGVGTVFGLVALGDKSAAHCVNDVCDTGTTGGIKSAALVSDIGWIAGGVLLATGAGMVLFAPSEGAPRSSGVRLTPLVTTAGAQLVAAGSW
jgi:hypothetical protein